MLKLFALIPVVLFGMAECDRGVVPFPVPAGGGGGSSSGGWVRPAPQSQPVGPAGTFNINEGRNVEGWQETHAVASPELCNKMLEKLRAMGKQVTLIRRYQTNDPLLPWMCEFQGYGKNVGDGTTFNDRRYNSRDEYNYP